jgi:uncharacterized lipoprotein NlpE involved in copper resistance
MNKIFIYLILSIITACGNSGPPDIVDQVPYDSEAALIDTAYVSPFKSSENIFGTFVGILPCADCKGIKMILKLDSTQKYTLSQEYLGKPDSSIEKTEGNWMMEEETYTIKLDFYDIATTKYFQALGTDSIRMKDREGKPFTSKSNYTLKKIK